MIVIIIIVVVLSLLLFLYFRNAQTPKEATKLPVTEAPKEATKLLEALPEALPEFIPSDEYTGSKPGYLYYKDKLGLGYYIDTS